MKNVKGLFTGETDKNGIKIYYETSKLKFPDGTVGKLMFDYGYCPCEFNEQLKRKFTFKWLYK